MSRRAYDSASVSEADAAIDRLVAASGCGSVEIDTRLDENRHGLRTPPKSSRCLARMDAVVTTRLHGLVLALNHGVPVVGHRPGTRGRESARAGAAFASGRPSLPWKSRTTPHCGRPWTSVFQTRPVERAEASRLACGGALLRACGGFHRCADRSRDWLEAARRKRRAARLRYHPLLQPGTISGRSDRERARANSYTS